jgi:ribosome-associated toxin RatA of RatAB toxin-antitoxin module
VHIEQTQVVKASPEEVFKAYADCEAWPKWQTLFKGVKVTKREGNAQYLEAEVKFLGRKSSRTEKHVMTPPEQILVEGEAMGITNTTLWKFEPVPEGTRVSAALDAQLPFGLKVVGPLVKRQARAALREWLQRLAKYVEAK